MLSMSRAGGKSMAAKKRQGGRPTASRRALLAKAPTGIRGLDEITEGGFPRGRSTLICGGAGSGKTMLAGEFLVRGALDYGEPGVLMAFEESSTDLEQNLASLGFPLADLVAAKKMVVDCVHFESSEMVETSGYSLEGLFVRLDMAIQAVGARRVALDSLEVLFAHLRDGAALRSELRRLFVWLQRKGVTSVITAERGDGKLTRQGLEEYVSDCVLLLDNRVENQFATRRLRIVKYRGSRHGMNEYPFLMGSSGISVLPVTSMGLSHEVRSEQVSTGIKRLDAMLGGGGYYQGSSILISGGSGTGKTSISSYFVEATCRAGQRCLVFLFEESPSQVVRNMRSIGVDLERWVKRGLLRFHAARPNVCGLETHLVAMHEATQAFQPSAVVIDPVSNLQSAGTSQDANLLLTRLIDYYKTNQITTVFTSLTRREFDDQSSEVGVSSLMDTWILLRNMEEGGERNRVLLVLKSRGMSHSNQVREFQLTGGGVELMDVYVGPGGVLAGSARLAQEAREVSEAVTLAQQRDRLKEEMERRILNLRAQSESLRLEMEIAEREQERIKSENTALGESLLRNRRIMAEARRADAASGGGGVARSRLAGSLPNGRH
jgi:circadian clock protein KaiC